MTRHDRQPAEEGRHPAEDRRPDRHPVKTQIEERQRHVQWINRESGCGGRSRCRRRMSSRLWPAMTAGSASGGAAARAHVSPFLLRARGGRFVSWASLPRPSCARTWCSARSADAPRRKWRTTPSGRSTDFQNSRAAERWDRRQAVPLRMVAVREHRDDARAADARRVVERRVWKPSPSLVDARLPSATMSSFVPNWRHPSGRP
jgi:hypothetical protein